MPVALTDDRRLAAYEFTVEPFHVDFTGAVSLSEMCGYILFCAADHAEHLGCGLRELLENGMSWFLTRAVIQMERYPGQYEKIRIETWVEQTNRLFSIRNMDFFDSEGTRFGGARLMWALMDMNAHTPVELSKVLPSLVNYALERPTALPKPIKVPDISSDAATRPPRFYEAVYSDIDINRHFNSVKYIERLGNLFPLEMYRDRQVTLLEINYTAEALYGMKLALFCEQVENSDTWLTTMQDAASGNGICRARWTWKQRD